VTFLTVPTSGTATDGSNNEIPRTDDINAIFNAIIDDDPLPGEQAAKKKTFAQVEQARAKAIDALIESTEVPVPEQMIEEEVARHLESEGLQPDDKHGEEVRESAQKSFQQQVILDEIIKAESVEVEQNEFTEFLFQQASQYGMAPQQYVEVLQQNNQMPQIIGEVARSKAILYVLEDAEVVDTAGNAVDISEYTAVVKQAREKQAEAETEADAEVEAETVEASDESK